MPVLRIAIGMILGVGLNVLHATLPSVRFCLPRPVQQLDAPEFFQCYAPPDSDSGTRLRFAPAVTSVLVTECPVLIGFVIAEHMGQNSLCTPS